jgi:hypothetical protein
MMATSMITRSLQKTHMFVATYTPELFHGTAGMTLSELEEQMRAFT